MVCEGTLDLGAVEELRTRLLAAIASGTGVEVVASSVERVDTANLQVLCAVARDLRAQGRPFRLTDASAPLQLAARRLGVGTLLGLEAVSVPGASAAEQQQSD